jgi:uncharacterized membrane protein
MLVSSTSVLLAVAVLVYFLHHIPASIRVNTVLAGIGRRLIRDIESRFPLEGGEGEPADGEGGETITARDVGYIEIIDFTELDRIARECGAVFSLRVRTGDFVHPHLPMLDLSGSAASEEIKDRIFACFSYGDSRTPAQDLEFLIDELAEIGMRALSPGVNDPFTAVTAMHWMGAALVKLADRDLRRGPEQESYDPARVRALADDFSHYIRRSFGALRASAAGDSIAASMFLQALAGVAAGSGSRERCAALLEEGRLLMRQARLGLEGPALETVEAEMQRFEEAASA